MSKGRKLTSIIDTFVGSTASLGAPTIFRKWTAISLIASVAEQRVWVKTSRALFPNLYIFLVAHPGVGKTRTIMEAKHIITEGKLTHLAPVSMTFASLSDALMEAKREILRVPEGKVSYNSLALMADEIGAFMHKYDNEMIAGLTAFYDPTPYQQKRRTGGPDDRGIEFEITSPQLNILAGSTPSNLIQFVPEGAWGQGFTSRVILVFSDEKIIVDDFGDFGKPATKELIHDLEIIGKLYGQFTVTQQYKDSVNAWRATGELPVPNHPKLIHYNTRRRVHIYKLSMLASLNRDNSLYLTEEDFWTAHGWLIEAETYMTDIFKAGAVNADSAAMEEILHFIGLSDVNRTGVAEARIVHFASERLPIQSIPRIIEILESTGQITCLRLDKHTGARFFTLTSNLRKHTPALKVIPKA